MDSSVVIASLIHTFLARNHVLILMVMVWYVNVRYMSYCCY